MGNSELSLYQRLKETSLKSAIYLIKKGNINIFNIEKN